MLLPTSFLMAELFTLHPSFPFKTLTSDFKLPLPVAPALMTSSPHGFVHSAQVCCPSTPLCMNVYLSGLWSKLLGRQEEYKVAIFNRVVRKHLAKKIRFEGRSEVGEGVGPVGFWTRVFQAEVVTRAKAPRHKGAL